MDLQAEAGADSGSSEAEEDVQATMTLVTEKRWLGRRGTRRPGLTFAQQMGLLVSRSLDQQHVSASITQSEWRPTGMSDGHTEDGATERSFYYNAASQSKPDVGLHPERSSSKLPNIISVGGNPFLDEMDQASAHIVPVPAKSISAPLKKSASGRLLDPVNLVSSESTTSESHRRPSQHGRMDTASSPLEHQLVLDVNVPVEEAGSETEKEEMDDEEEDDSPYLIEDSNPAANQAVSSERLATFDDRQKLSGRADDQDDSSSLSQLTDDEDDEHEFATVEIDEGRLSPVKAKPSLEENRRPPAITRYLSAAKTSSSSLSEPEKSPLESDTLPEPHVLQRPRRSRSRERKAWNKPIPGNVDENPFLASSAAGKPKGRSTGTEYASGSWLRTDNARARRNEGEKPTIDYLL